MTATIETIQEAIKLGYPVTIIINGEYYEVQEDNDNENH